jgi:hypothetical protein
MPTLYDTLTLQQLKDEVKKREILGGLSKLNRTQLIKKLVDYDLTNTNDNININNNTTDNSASSASANSSKVKEFIIKANEAFDKLEKIEEYLNNDDSLTDEQKNAIMSIITN